MAVAANGERTEVPGAPGYWRVSGRPAGELPLPVRRITLHAPARLGAGTGEAVEVAIIGPREVPVGRAVIERCPEEGIASFEIVVAAIAPEATVIELLGAVAEAAIGLGARRLFALVPLDHSFGIEVLTRAGFVLESVLTEGGVAEVALRVPSPGFEAPFASA